MLSERFLSSQTQYTPRGPAPSREKTPNRLRSISKKPPSSESGPRRAHRRDVENSPLKRTACQLYGVLCDCLDHTAYSGLAWPKVETLARRMKVTSRTVQRALGDLTSAGWIGTPFGDEGGARDGIVYHLHPDGKPCLFCVAADRTVNQRGKPPEPDSTGDKKSPVIQPTGDILTPVTPDKMSPLSAPTGDILAATGDIFDSAYKEMNSLKNLSKSTSTTLASKPADPPEEFLREMDGEIELDEGALRRLWSATRQIVPDATAEEIRYFFYQRAAQVFRNRRVQSPVGLMLSTISDWFAERRVLQRREDRRHAEERMKILEREVASASKPRQSRSAQPTAQKTDLPPPGERFDMSNEIRAAAAKKAMR